MASPRALFSASSRLLLVLLALSLLAACVAPGAHGGHHDHDAMHASCFKLVTGEAVTPSAPLRTSSFTLDDVESPAPSAAPPTPTRAWSDAAGWPQGQLPQAGDSVQIGHAEVVLLDVSPPALASLEVHGALVFDRADLSLEVGSMVLHGGLYVGSAAEPFTHRAVITVGAAERGEHSDCFGYDYLGLVHGTLELYGDPEGPAWTRLAATAPAGATSITVDDASGWREGDLIAIANTDFYTPNWSAGIDRQIEVRTITARSGDTLSLDRPLDYAHLGEARTFTAPALGLERVLESRAEVMRLNRNVTLRGVDATTDEAADAYRFGGHVMALGDSRVRLDSVEVTAMGQEGELMRYPVHFHLQGEAAHGSFVRNSSLHHLYNRCVTIHGSSGVLLEGNAAYDTFGHCYFLEDGAETRNVLKGNFGMMAREPSEEKRILPTDGGHMGPSIFWITNPDNVLVGNVAASSAGSGFWYSLPEHPTGPSYDVFDGANVWPRRTPLGRFEGNVAHSNNNDGLHVDRGPAQGTLRGETARYRPRANPAELSSEPMLAEFAGFVAYRHRQAAAWFRGDHTVLTDALLVDNAIGATFASNASGMERSIVVGWSGPGELPPVESWREEFMIRGFEFYDGEVFVRDSHFEGFDESWTRPGGEARAAALSILDFTSFSLSPLNHASNLTFAPGTREVWFESRSVTADSQRTRDDGEDGYRSGLFLDVGGSVTGALPGSGAAGLAVSVRNPLLEQAGCTVREEWNALVCDGAYAALTLRDSANPGSGLAPVTLRRTDLPQSQGHTLHGSPNGGPSVPNVHFRAAVPLGKEFRYDFAGAAPSVFTLELSAARPGDTLLVSVPYGSRQSHVYRDWWIDPRSRIASYPSLTALRSAPGTGYYLQEGVRLYLKLEVDPSRAERNYAHLTICAREGC